MIFQNVAAFRKWLVSIQAEIGEPIEGWVDYRNDGTVEFTLADTSEPYGV